MADSKWSEWKKSTLRAKLKVTNQEDLKWKEYFKNLFGNSLEEIINGQRHIKFWQFAEEELVAVLKKKNEKQKSCKPQ